MQCSARGRAGEGLGAVCAPAVSLTTKGFDHKHQFAVCVPAGTRRRLEPGLASSVSSSRNATQTHTVREFEGQHRRRGAGV